MDCLQPIKRVGRTAKQLSRHEEVFLVLHPKRNYLKHQSLRKFYLSAKFLELRTREYTCGGGNLETLR